MGILGFQLAIIATLLVGRAIGPRVCLAIAVLWTIETFALVHFAPLILFQLAVIWLTCWAVSSWLEATSGSSAGRSRMKAASDCGRDVRRAVDILARHARRIQSTKQDAHRLGPEYVAKYTRMHDKLLFRLSRDDRRFLERQNGVLKNPRFQPPWLAHEELRAEHERFLGEFRASLSVDPELRDIFVEVTEQLKLANLRQMALSPGAGATPR